MASSILRPWLCAGLLALSTPPAWADEAAKPPVVSPDQIQSEDDLSRLVDALGAGGGAAPAAPAEPSLGAVTAEMVPATVAPGEKFELVVHVAVKAGAHAYPDAAQTKEGPSSVYFSCAGGSCGPVQFGAPAWPKAAQVKNILGETEAVYRGEVLIRIPGTAPDKAGAFTAKGAFKGRYCDDAGSCYPSREYPWEATLAVAVKAEPAPLAPGPAPVSAAPAEFPASAPAPEPAATDLAVMAEAVPARVAPGGAFEVRVHVAPPPGMHTYPDKAQNADSISAVKADPVPGIAFGKPAWPKAETWESKVRHEKEQVYLHEAVIRLTAVMAKDAAPGVRTLKGTFKGQTCNEDTCYLPKEYPWEAAVTVDPAAGEARPPTEADAALAKQNGLMSDAPVSAPLFSQANLSLLLLALVGGFLLNFMPCVLPVIPIKILGLAQAAGTRARRLALGGAMSAGVVALWLGMGALIAGGALGGMATLFKYPAVNFGLGLFIVLMALFAAGLLPLRLPQAVYRVSPKHDSLGGSFAFGLMTGVFALPCIGPFMGGASAAALKSGDARLTLAVFAVIGVGMALPYLVLAANPKWVDKLPRSGPASDVMKRFLGWLMLAGGAYFLASGLVQWVDPVAYFAKQANWLALTGFGAVAGVVLAWGCASLLKTASRKILPALFLALGFGLAGLCAWQVYETAATRPFPFLRFESEAKLPLGQGKLVVVDFRSTTCVNCDWNERTVFNTIAGRALLGADDVIAYQANIDHAEDAALVRKLSGIEAVPFLAVYDAQGRLAATLPTIITMDKLQEAIEKARQSK